MGHLHAFAADFTRPDPVPREDLGRLEGLSRGLAKEAAVIGDADDPLLYLERRAYLCALADALGGVEAARVAPAKALARLDGHGDAGAMA